MQTSVFYFFLFFKPSVRHTIFGLSFFTQVSDPKIMRLTLVLFSRGFLIFLQVSNTQTLVCFFLSIFLTKCQTHYFWVRHLAFFQVSDPKIVRLTLVFFLRGFQFFLQGAPTQTLVCFFLNFFILFVQVSPTLQ